MERMAVTAVRRVGVVGTGVIGSAWAAHFLRMGLEVAAWDPDPAAAGRLRRFVQAVWPTLAQMGLRPGASPERLSFVADLAGAVAAADFVQESAPEDAATKIKLLAQIDAAARPETVIASSTSGYAMSLLQQECRHPERTVVGHPFNPPYLMPLVEVVGGQNTDPSAVDWAVSFYRQQGKFPLKMSQELPGFIANRLQEAMWREALHMVHEGMASVAEIDAAIVNGPGLRWAIFGPCLTFHLAGGEGGMGHMLDHFDPTRFAGWSKLQSPPITPELRQAMVDGCLEEAGSRSIRQLEAERDRKLLAIMSALAAVAGD